MAATGTRALDCRTSSPRGAVLSAQSSTTLFRERGRYAALTRSRPADDPELLEAQRSMREEALVVAIKRALKNAPPLTAHLRDRVIALFVDRQGAA